MNSAFELPTVWKVENGRGGILDDRKKKETICSSTSSTRTDTRLLDKLLNFLIHRLHLYLSGLVSSYKAKLMRCYLRLSSTRLDDRFTIYIQQFVIILVLSAMRAMVSLRYYVMLYLLQNMYVTRATPYNIALYFCNTM